MNKNEAHTRGIELEAEGWEFWMEGKKPLHSYYTKKDGVTIKGSSPTDLVKKINTHLTNKTE